MRAGDGPELSPLLRFLYTSLTKSGKVTACVRACRPCGCRPANTVRFIRPFTQACDINSHVCCELLAHSLNTMETPIPLSLPSDGKFWQRSCVEEGRRRNAGVSFSPSREALCPLNHCRRGGEDVLDTVGVGDEAGERPLILNETSCGCDFLLAKRLARRLPGVCDDRALPRCRAVIC